MSILFGIIFFFVCFFIISMILLQEGKGGGIAAIGGGAMDGVMGARNPLRRWTAYLSIAFVLLALIINYTISRRGLVDVPQGVETAQAAPAPMATLPAANLVAPPAATPTTVTTPAPAAQPTPAPEAAKTEPAAPAQPAIPAPQPAAGEGK